MNITMSNLVHYASRFDGRKYGQECTREEEQHLKDAGIVMVFGASDDLCEFRGAIHDEEDCWQGGEVYLEPSGLIKNECGCGERCPNWKPHGVKLAIIWDEHGWHYEIDVLHATFKIFDEEDLYCKGIVFWSDMLVEP